MADGVSARGAAGRLDALQPPTAGAVTPGTAAVSPQAQTPVTASLKLTQNSPAQRARAQVTAIRHLLESKPDRTRALDPTEKVQEIVVSARCYPLHSVFLFCTVKYWSTFTYTHTKIPD